jgi:hypothetical protein
MTGMRITVTGATQVRVVVTVTELAATAWYLRIAEIILGAVLATGSGVSLEALAHYVLRY